MLLFISATHLIKIQFPDVIKCSFFSEIFKTLFFYFRCLIDSREDHRYNIEAVDLLIRSSLVIMAQYDIFLVQLMENGLNMIAITFAMQLVQRYCIDDKINSHVTEVVFTSY